MKENLCRKSLSKVESRTHSILFSLLPGLVLCCSVLFAPLLAGADTVTMPLVNNTRLDLKDYTIYVLGFSTGATSPAVVNPKMLTVDTNTKTGTFIDTPANSPTDTTEYIPSYKLGDEITGIEFERGSAVNDIIGARIYFFVADNNNTGAYSEDGYPPRFPYLDDGAEVTQVGNPPQTDYPVYNYVELTYKYGYGTVIDVSTVDGFFFPLTVTLNDSLGQLGQPLPDPPAKGLTRLDILDEYEPFMSTFGVDGAPYLDLQYTSNQGGLLNPSHYFDMPDGVTSPLNTVFDAALNTLFADTSLSIEGDASGGISTDTYTVTSTSNQTYPGTSFSHPALQLTGKNNSKVFTIFNPIGFCVVNYKDSGGNLQSIIGSMKDNKLTFKTSLPSGTALEVGMYVTGVGADASTTITAINTNGSGEIVSLTLSNGTGTPAPDSQYRFSRSPHFSLSSGEMVFGNFGLFADASGHADADEQAVIKGLQRDIVSALNRGVAYSAPASGSDGYTSEYWGTETNWYPDGHVQNLFSYFMHTAIVSKGGTTIPIFTRPDNAVQSARGTTMGMSYGFGYDENPVHAPGNQPQVPSKYDPVPAGTTSMAITLGPWQDKAFPWHMFHRAFIFETTEK